MPQPPLQTSHAANHPEYLECIAPPSVGAGAGALGGAMDVLGATVVVRRRG